MGKLRRSIAALSTTAFLVAGSSMMITTGVATAAGPLVAGSCGATLKGDAGAPVSLDLASALGISGAPTISLGKTPAGTKTFSVPKSELLAALGDLPLLGAVLPSVCKVTVTGVNTATAPVQDAVEKAKKSTAPATGPVDEVVKKVTDTVESLLGGGGDPGKPSDPKDPAGDPKDKPGDPAPNSPALGGSDFGYRGIPYQFSPISGFSTLPYRTASFDFGSAPGLRYGTDYSGYAPDFGMLGQDGSQQSPGVRNAGSADALPPVGAKAVGLPVLIAVLALAGASAGLVRTWVLRRAAAMG